MTRENAKALLNILKAYSEGKKIEVFNGKEWINLERPFFNSEPNCYRIKTELKYRPFKSVEECWEEMQKHQPFGWYKYNNDNYNLVTYLSKRTDFDYLFKTYTFADGTPFGIKEEE